MSQKILVIGSSNTDMVVKTVDFPLPGQTVLGGKFLMNPGGKGANQAVAASRLGANVRFVTRVGDDIFGQQALEGFRKENLDIEFTGIAKEIASGVALITVAESGENQIVVASGANMDLKPENLSDTIFQDTAFALLQLEIPIETVQYAIQKCKDLDIKVILNPAPATKLDESILNGLYLITPNETETEILTGIRPDSPANLLEAGHTFLKRGVQNVLITLGKEGVFFMNHNLTETIPAQVVQAVDTTAAGDVFNGALITALANGKDFIEACHFANKAAALAVTRMGAQSSAPYIHELN